MSTDESNVAARLADFEQSGICPDCQFMGEDTIDPMTHGPVGHISHSYYASVIQHMKNGCEVAKYHEASQDR